MGLLKKAGAKADANELVNACESLGLEMPKKKSLAGLVKLLREHFEGTLKGVPKDDWIVCAVCGEHTDDDDRIYCCPFCGDKGSDEDREIKEEEPEEDDYPEAEVVERPSGGNGEIVKPETEEDHAALMVARLEEEKVKIEGYKKSLVRNGYELGASFKRIKDDELWKAEGHYNFSKFVRSMDVSSALVYNLISMVENFSYEEFEAAGGNRLRLVAKADKGDEGPEPGTEKEKRPREAPEPKDGVSLVVKVGGKPKTYPFVSRKSQKQISTWQSESYIEVPITEDVSMFMSLKTDDKNKVIGTTVVFKRSKTGTAEATPEKEAPKTTAKKTGHTKGGLKGGKSTCSQCGKPGHNKRSCPEKEQQTTA